MSKVIEQMGCGRRGVVDQRAAGPRPGHPGGGRQHRPRHRGGVAGGAVGMMLGAAAAQPHVRRRRRSSSMSGRRASSMSSRSPFCHFERQPVFDEDGNPAGSRRVRVCD